MSRRWRNPRPRRGRVFWTPPAQAVTTTSPPPQFLRPVGPPRMAARPRGRNRVFWVTPPPPGPTVIIATGEPYFRWTTGSPYLS